MPVTELPIFSYFNKQRFVQYGCGDLANWYGVNAPDTKRSQALYPAMGRRHINFFGFNQLIFNNEPSQIFKTINYWYAIDGTTVIQVDQYYNQKILGNVPLGSQTWFAYLPVGNLVYAMLTTGTQIFVIIEDGNNVTMTLVTDPNAPKMPRFVGAFGNRFVVNNDNTPDYFLSQINLGGVFVADECFTINGAPLFNRASGIVRQIGVLHNLLYIFCDFTTDIWANIPSYITSGEQTTEFPWKLNTSYNWDFGISDPFSLSIDFGRMVFLAKNNSGLVTFRATNGQQPIDISSQAINVLLQNSTQSTGLSPFLTSQVNGFLYQYENTIFYRVSAGEYVDYGQLDIIDNAYALEFNFATQTWARVIELNGERNRIQKHIYFNNMHLVTVQNDTAVYEMGGNFYYNELRTPGTMPQDVNAFTKYPFRYELKTQQIFDPDYSEFITDYVEIDFVFGDQDFYKFNAPSGNTVFIITEDAAPDGSPIYCIAEDQENNQPVFLIIEGTNTYNFDDNYYYALFKPNITLYFSDDGGVTYTSADLLEFSQLGQYQWRMRWYELGPSRNRSYMLVGVSSAPLVILGAVQNRRRASGGAN